MVNDLWKLSKSTKGTSAPLVVYKLLTKTWLQRAHRLQRPRPSIPAACGQGERVSANGRPLAKKQMSAERHCEGHAQFHRRKLLKASSQSRSLCVSLSRGFSPGASVQLIPNCLALACSRAVAFIMRTPNRWQVCVFLQRCEMGLRELTCIPLAATLKWVFFRNIINQIFRCIWKKCNKKDKHFHSPCKRIVLRLKLVNLLKQLQAALTRRCGSVD